jgi:hypothetical protein
MDWEESRKAAFGDASSIVQAVMRNPMLLARHVLENAATLPFAMLTMPAVTTFPFLSPHIHSLLAWIQLSTFVGVVVLFARTALARPQSSKHTLRRRLLVVGLTVCFPNIISALVIYPRWHYLVIPTLVTLVLFWTFLSLETEDTFPDAVKVRPEVLAVALLLAIPNLATGWLPAPAGSRPVEVGLKAEREKQVLQSRFYSSFPRWSTVANFWLSGPFAEYEEGKRVLENRSVIHFIRSLNIVREVNVLAGQGYCNYLAENYRPVYPWEKDDSFTKFLLDRQIGMILVQEFLLTHPSFADDIEFDDFLRKSDRHGFLKLEIPGAQWPLLVKRELLEQGIPGGAIN